MTTKVEEVLNSVSEMTVIEVCDLIEQMEEKFGVSAAAPVAVAAAPAAGEGAQAEEKTEFNVILEEMGSNKVAVIKAVRALTGLGLKEAKDAVEGAPYTLKEGVAKEEAEDMKKKLEEAGAKAKLA